jgi:glycosyltransferase involved in cell wall biosynthesis
MVSVVMAAYDAAGFVGDAIRSVIAQSHEDWELLVVDDGSADQTGDIVRSFGDDRIRLLSIGHCGVLGRVRNVGIGEASGEAIALLDADDVWLPRKLELQVACLERRPEVGVVHTAAELLLSGERVPAPPGRIGAPLLRRLLEGNFVYSSSAVVRRSLLTELGPFEDDPALGGSPDYDLWLRLAPHTTFAYLDEVLLLYRVHGEQMSADACGMHEGALAALANLSRRDPVSVEREAAAFAFAVGMRRQLARQPGRGRKELLRAVRLRPGYLLAWRWLARSLVSSS